MLALRAGGGVYIFYTLYADSRVFGSSFNFDDRGQYDLSYRFQHLSNAGIKSPNDGINFHLVRFA